METSAQLTGISSLYSAMNLINSPTMNYETYRKMRKNPTILLARAVSNAPILKSYFSVNTKDGVSDEIKQFIQDQMDYIWPVLIKNVILAKDYGFQAFEKVWEVVDGKYSIRKLKPIVPDKVTIKIVEGYNTFGGIKVGSTTLSPDKCWVYTHQQEGDNYYGESQMESLLHNAWIPWVKTATKLDNYASKVSGVIPMVKYPIGVSKDATGAEQSNFELAKGILASLGSGAGVAMPQELLPWAQDLARAGIDPDQWASWKIQFLETAGDHSGTFLNTMRHYESLMMRGWLVPERTALEGNYGTKAESETQGDLALDIAELTYNDILMSVNWHIVNQLLIINFGSQYENRVWLEPAGLDADTKRMFRTIMSTVLTAPSNVDLLREWVNIDTIFDALGIPKTADTLDTEPDEDETELNSIIDELQSRKNIDSSAGDSEDREADESAAKEGESSSDKKDSSRGQ